MTERIFPPGSPEPDARVTKVWRAVSATDGISYLRVVPALAERLDYRWVHEGGGVAQTWAEINVYALRDMSETDDRPADQRPPLSLDDVAQMVADTVGGDATHIREKIQDAFDFIASWSKGEKPTAAVVDMRTIERYFSLAASDPGAYATRRRWPSDQGDGVDYEPVSSWVAHACAHVAVGLLPQMLACLATAPKPEPAPVTTVSAEQLEDAATMLHRDECYDRCDVHSMTSFREKALRMFGAAGVLAVGVPATKVAEIRVRQHRELVSVVTGVPIEELP